MKSKIWNGQICIKVELNHLDNGLECIKEGFYDG